MLEELSGLDGGPIADVGSAELSKLEKALSAGSGAGFQSTGARALINEDLESTLRAVSFTEEHFKKTLFSRLKARAAKARSTVHEFNRFTDYGETGGFSSEIATIEAIDANFQRDFAQVRFLRTKRQVSSVAQLTNTMENLVAAQVAAGTRFLVKQANRYLFDGDNAMNPGEWDGLFKVQQAKGLTSHYIDKAGATMSASDLENGAYLMQQDGSWGLASDLFLPLTVQYSLDQNLIGGQQRVNFFNDGKTISNATGFGENASILAGMGLSGFRTSAGIVRFMASEFTRSRQTIYKDPTSGAEAATSVNAPSTPVFNLVVGTAVGGSRQAAGTIYYRVAAENANGESLAAAVQNATVVSTGTVTVNIAAPSGGWGSNPTAFRIYAGTSASALYLIARVSATAGSNQITVGTVPGISAQVTGTAAGTFTTGGVTYTIAASYQDGAQRIPNTHRVYMLDLDSPGELQALGWAQMAPMTKEDLPRGDTFIQWIQFLYGTPVYYAPNKIMIYDNVAGAL